MKKKYNLLAAINQIASKKGADAIASESYS